ncbi:MAG: hypothetical protein H7Y00_11375 [Fimbriimonadaceae bacterium]|nr:hypothetical protein [Chitinophagales bacterium]
MIKYLFIGMLALFVSCNGSSNKMIEDFSDKIKQFEMQVDLMSSGSGTDELMKTAGELSSQIDALNAEDLSEKQHEMVGALSVRLNIAINTLQTKLQKQLQDTINTQPTIPDSLNIQTPKSDKI